MPPDLPSGSCLRQSQILPHLSKMCGYGSEMVFRQSIPKHFPNGACPQNLYRYIHTFGACVIGSALLMLKKVTGNYKLQEYCKSQSFYRKVQWVEEFKPKKPSPEGVNIT